MLALLPYLQLTKPRILPLVLLTGLPALYFSNHGAWPAWTFCAAVLLGIALAAAAANVLNMFIERERDALMARTRTRPLPTGRITPRAALCFGAALALTGTALLWRVSGAPAAALSVASILFYVFVYTVWLKPRSRHHAVVGGAAGAAAPLIADAAVSGGVGLPGLVLFAIVFLWQPPHVFAIALYRRADYAAAGIPTQPAVVGAARTHWHMLAYSAGLLPMTLAPVWLGWLGTLYATAACALGLWFVWSQLQLLHAGTTAGADGADDGAGAAGGVAVAANAASAERAARRVFLVSLAYLFLLYVAMLVDRVVAGAV